MINVMLVDDHRLIRESMKQLLEMEGDIKVTCEAEDGNECLKLINEYPIDIILLDINMPNKNGIETLSEIRNKKYPVKVLMLTMHNEIEYLVKATDIGVDGYILKEAGYRELKEAIENIYRGENYIQTDLIPLLNNYLINKDTDLDKIESLTKRELEVLKEIARGGFNKDIAAKLNISERTIKNHISNIFKKIGVNDRTQAAVFAIKNNLISIK